MKITIVGTGYVGLVTGVCLADLGNTVTCVDKDVEKVAELSHGNVPFYEPGLADLLRRNQSAGRIKFTDALSIGIQGADVVFIAVGTPSTPKGRADLSIVHDVSDAIMGLVLDNSFEHPYTVLVTKSTVPVGTSRLIQQKFLDSGISEERVAVVSNPEFLREGSAVHDFFKPDRVVIGGDSDRAVSTISQLYHSLYRIEAPIIKTSLESSELSKYASNAFLATKISFINEIANLCEKVNADVHAVAKIMGADGRIGKYFLQIGRAHV